MTLARQRVVGVADPYRVGAYNAIMPITPRTRRKHFLHFLKFSAVHCRVRRLDAPLPPSAAQNASSKQSELNSTNETIKFSVTLARQRVVGVADPYRVGAYNAIMPITPRTRRKHFLHFLKFSAVHCRVRRLDAPLPPSAAQNASSKQSELNSTNETIKFSVTLARQRVVGVADPYRVGAYNAIIPTTHGHGTNISCIFSNSPQSIVGVRRLDAPLPPSAAQNSSSKQGKLNSMNIASAHSVPNFGLSNP